MFAVIVAFLKCSPTRQPSVLLILRWADMGRRGASAKLAGAEITSALKQDPVETSAGTAADIGMERRFKCAIAVVTRR
jgi:hypothetical protein